MTELAFLNIKPQPLNLILPVTSILIGGLTIGIIFVLVELVQYRKTIKNIKPDNNTSFLAYLKGKFSIHNQKKELNTLSVFTLQKVEEIIEENKE